MSQEQQNSELVMAMFKNISEAMNLKPIDKYFSEDFLLSSNKVEMDLQAFKDHMEVAFNSLKAISFKKPFADIIAKNDRVVLRATIVVTDKNNTSTETEFIAIFQIKELKIHRWWELTYPAW